MSDKPLREYKKPNKLIPRDISEALGKLPPQALDMEEAVLGALMLERSAFDIVNKFLKEDHFYKEGHKDIFRAIVDLAAQGDPVDMRNVRNRLSKTGKLELVGGAFYIASLTTAVSSGANVESHARVIVEQAVKRQLIQIASQIHRDAYEDTTDCFDLLDRTIETVTRFKDTTTLENRESRIKAMWAERLLVTQPPPEIPLIQINGVTVATAGNHSLLTGKKKSRKTLFITWLMKLFFEQNQAQADDVILFDTEQGKSHVWKVKQKIKQLTGHDIPIHTLRGMPPVQRREYVTDTVRYWKKKPRIIVLDGIRDFMSNINDADETTEVLVWLEAMVLQDNIHIMEILHLNKTDNNVRGHIGTELQNKAEITIELEKDEKSGVTIVKCESSRDKDFDSFSFTHGKDDLPEIVGTPIRGQDIPQDERRVRVIAAYADGPMTYKESVEELKKQFGIGKTKAEFLMAEITRLGWVVKGGNNRDPKALYKLMITTDAAQDPQVAPAPILQQEFFVPETPDDDPPPEDLPF